MTNGLKAWRRGVEDVYRAFFEDMGINPENGNVAEPPPRDRKFACYPYIGSKYGCGRKVLFVGLDIGSDENEGKGIQSFEHRRRKIEDRCLKCHNPHMAGTYFTAMKYAGPKEMRNEFARFEDAKQTCQSVLKNCAELPERNPLSYIALTNYYKWVTSRARKKAGGSDRKHVPGKREVERHLLREEMRILEPELVIFQSTTLSNVSFGETWLVLPHPSFPNAKKQRPGYVTKPKCGGGKALKKEYR